MTDEAKELRKIRLLLERMADHMGVPKAEKKPVFGSVTVLKTRFGVPVETGSQDVPPALSEEERHVVAAQGSDKRVKQGERRVDRQPVEGRGTR